MEAVAVSSESLPQPRRLRHWRVVRLIAAIIIVMISCMITAQAFGVDVFGAIARWSEETFKFEAPVDTAASTNTTLSQDFPSLHEALKAYGIKEMVVPNRFPTGYQMSILNISTTSDSTKFQAAYENGDKFFSITVWQLDSIEQANSHTFEKDNSDVSIYEYGNIKHYLMSNNEQTRVTWINANIMCAISGDLSEEEFKDMIKSIYER
jgi:hypothetical protein